MPERWESDLQKLRTVQPSVDTWRRAQDPPSGDGLPPRRQRLVAGAVAVVVFILAGAFAWRAWQPAPHLASAGGGSASGVRVDLHVVATKGATSSGPEAQLTVAGRTIKGVPTSYCWQSDNVQMCADATTPTFKPANYVHVTQGVRLHVSGDAQHVSGDLERPSDVLAGRFRKVQDFGAITGPVTLNAPDGAWILHLAVSWSQGDVNYYFPLAFAKAGGPTLRSLPLRGTKWRLGAIDGTVVHAGAHPFTLNFGPRQLGGSDGCNDYGGPYRVRGDVIKTGEIIQTLVLCSGGVVHAADIFGRRIHGATTYDFIGANLIVHSPHHEFTFVPANP